MKKKTPERLIFVYNADSGAANAFFDSMHKVLSPKTYACKLCELTHGLVKENRTWKRFRQRTDNPLVFLHKDEFAKKYASKFGHNFTFPIVLAEVDQGLEVVIPTDELNQLKTVHALIRLVNERT